MRAKNMNLYRCFYEAFAFNLFWFNQTLPKTDLFKKTFSYEFLIDRKLIFSKKFWAMNSWFDQKTGLFKKVFKALS